MLDLRIGAYRDSASQSDAWLQTRTPANRCVFSDAYSGRIAVSTADNGVGSDLGLRPDNDVVAQLSVVTNDGLTCHNGVFTNHSIPADDCQVSDDGVVVNVCTGTNGHGVAKRHILAKGHAEANGG